MAEVGGRGTAGHDEAVVGDGEGMTEFVGMDGARTHVDARHVGQDHPQAPVVAQDVAGRRRDLPLREDARRHLVEQWLEEVMVRPVDQGHADRSQFQGSGGEQAAEARPDDHDVVPLAGRVVPPHSKWFTTVVT